MLVKCKCDLKVTIFSGSIFKGLLPVLKLEDARYHAICLNVPLHHVLNYERICIRAEVRTSDVELSLRSPMMDQSTVVSGPNTLNLRRYRASG